MRDPYQIVRRPLVTEKGTGMAEKGNAYTFEVAPDANKVEIRKAIEKLFDVRVVSVNTMLRKGKVKGQGFRSWQRADRKRAIVKLAPGQSIEFI
jgi:large subunit ribosomal protein L23